MVVLLLPKNDQFLDVGFVPTQPALNGGDSLFGMDPIGSVVATAGAFHGLAISIFCSSMSCRGELMALSVMRDAPVLMEVANPSSQVRTPCRAIDCVVRRRALPREQVSPLSPLRTR